jgi:nitrite reductase (NO-forming)/hydroxylamine reductase
MRVRSFLLAGIAGFVAAVGFFSSGMTVSYAQLGSSSQPSALPGVPELTPVEFVRANRIFFERCAGCHGVLRKGATGKPLTPEVTRQKGYEHLHEMITNGSPAGMPNWGTSGALQKEDVDLMTRYVMNQPAQPPEFGLEQMKQSWKVFIPVAQRPTER